MANLTSLIQESLLSLLCYDVDNGGRVCSLVPVDVWDGPYRLVAAKAVDYWAKYKKPPGEHTLDLFTDAGKSADKVKAKQIRRVYESMEETRQGINAEYVIGQVSAFLREQRLRAGIINAVGLLEQGKLTDAEDTVRKGLSGVLDVFHPGLLFHDVRVSDVLSDDRQAIPMGIKLLDERKLGPTAGELSLFIAPPGYGKSWWLIHLAKLAVIHRRRVVYVTLEMSEHRVAQRFLQTFCVVSKRQERMVNRMFLEDELGRFCGIKAKEIKKLSTFEDEGIEVKLTKQVKQFRRRSPLVIRQFPTGALTVRELKAYLDSLEMSQRIVPDLLLVDYADLMSVGTRDYRHELSSLYKDLRGLAVERNIAVATASQANRESSGKKFITGRGVAEDFSKIATADVVITYNRTEAELRLGTARLYIDKGRNDEDKFSVLITQNYKTGQFCLSSTRMMDRYWRALEQSADDKGDEDDTMKRERL